MAITVTVTATVTETVTPTPIPTPISTPAPTPDARFLPLPSVAIMAKGGIYACGEGKNVGGVIKVAQSWYRAIYPQLTPTTDDKAENPHTKNVCYHTHTLDVSESMSGGPPPEVLTTKLTFEPEKGGWEAFHAWRREPIFQSFGGPPNEGFPDYSVEVEGGAILCELLSQSSFAFTLPALNNLLPVPIESMGGKVDEATLTGLRQLIMGECATPEGAGRLAGLVVG